MSANTDEYFPLRGELYKIFVYGTLKRGFPLHSALGSSIFVCEAETHGVMYDLGYFPACSFYPDGGKIQGEVFLVNFATLHDLDRIEHGYERTKIDVFDEAQRIFHRCYAYQITPSRS